MRAGCQEMGIALDARELMEGVSTGGCFRQVSWALVYIDDI
jgi:hypothetical protein